VNPKKCKRCKYRARWYNALLKPIWFHNSYVQAWLCMLKDYGKKGRRHNYLYCYRAIERCGK